MRHGPKKYGYDATRCQRQCSKYMYIALQHNGWCSCDNQFATPARTYRRVPDRQCGSNLRGGGYRNAIYSNPAYTYTTSVQWHVNGASKSWNDVKKMCESNGRRLCKRHELCPCLLYTSPSPRDS